MNRIDLALDLGATRPFQLLHASDTHLCLADERDNERKRTLAQKRARVFPDAEANLEEIRRVSEAYRCPIAYTGDLIDFVSFANLDAARRFTEACDVVMAAGNHEFSQYVGEAFEDRAYREQSLDRVQGAFKNDIRAFARVINGVKLIALDNSYYLFEKEQLAFLRDACKEGLPVILLLHTPLYTPALHRFMIEERKNPCGYLCGSPEELIASYPPDRQRQQRPDDCTLETIAFIKGCACIRCILSGHIHTSVASAVRPDLPQYAIGLNEYAMVNIE